MRLSFSTLYLALILGSAAACARGEDAATSDTPAAVAGAPDTAMAGHSMSDMANMTGDADRDFLRMMSDHHMGLSAMARGAKERTDIGSVAADARKMDAMQDAETKRMTGMLADRFQDQYAPKVAPEHQRMADELTPLTGPAYARKFVENVIAHHRQALAMVEEYLPKAKLDDVRQMAEKMRTDQTREISELEKKLSALPSR